MKSLRQSKAPAPTPARMPAPREAQNAPQPPGEIAPAAARPDVVQRPADQRAAQPGVAPVRVGLGVREQEGVPAPLVGGEAEQPLAVPDLVLAGLRVVAHGELHGTSMPRRGTGRGQRAMTARAPAVRTAALSVGRS